MKTDPSSDKLASLISRLVDGLLDEAGKVELEEHLRRNRAARDYYRRYLATHLDLAERLRADEAANDVIVPVVRRRALPWLAAAAVLALATGLGWWWLGTQLGRIDGGGPTVVTITPSGPVLAVTSRVENVKWNLREKPATGIKLVRTPVDLTEGTLALNLVGGQSLTLRAPARFELVDTDEMRLDRGDASLLMAGGKPPYVIRVPSGAVVDLGTEFSLKVDADGTADVWVFEGQAAASLTDAKGRTRTDRVLGVGESVRMGSTLGPSQARADDFVRPLASAPADRSPAGGHYADAVTRSAPRSWWRFEGESPSREIADNSGAVPLQLNGNATIMGAPGHRFLYVDAGEMSGFAVAEQGIEELDRAPGFTVECLLHPGTEDFLSAVALDEPGIPVKDGVGGARLNVVHPPQRLVIERMRHCGDHIGHVHPDFALRGMIRSPAGYVGGINTYSSESYILHRWVHVALTYDGEAVRMYVDGRLSDEAPAELPFQQGALRPIIGRMQPLARGEKRQWIGGIDEVALYGRPLAAEEIRAHFDALEH